jgi:hypothetical protein
MSNLGLIAFGLIVAGFLMLSFGNERTIAALPAGEVAAVMCPTVDVKWSPCE